MSGNPLKPVSITASRTMKLDDNGGTFVLNAAAGLTITLPAASGLGTEFEFIVGTAVTSNNDVIQVVGNDTMTGRCMMAADAGDTSVVFETAADSDTITMNGSTKGGLKGDRIKLRDIAADLWSVEMECAGTGTEATPFSAAVS